MASLFEGPSIEVLQPCSHLRDAYHLVTMQYKEPNFCVLDIRRRLTINTTDIRRTMRSGRPLEITLTENPALKYIAEKKERSNNFIRK